MNIAIIYGGKSSEHEVSLLSASSIVRTISADHRVYLIGIAKNGAWYLQDDSVLEAVRTDSRKTLSVAVDFSQLVSIIPAGGCEQGIVVNGAPVAVDVIFPVLHGTGGEDGTIQGLLELIEIPYVGGGVFASSAAMDKEKAKMIWQHADLPVVPFCCIRKNHWDDPAFRDAVVPTIEYDFTYPLFIKPSRAGSSVGAGKAENRADLIERIQNAFIWDTKVIIEPCIDAREIECSVTGNETITVYTPGEIISSHEFYDYDAKYTDPDGARLKIPAEISSDQQEYIQDIAAKAYQALDLTGLSRVDFFIDKHSEQIYLNEVNTIPGFTSISMFPKMCAASGLDYAELIMMLLHLAIERFEAAQKIRTDRTI